MKPKYRIAIQNTHEILRTRIRQVKKCPDLDKRPSLGGVENLTVNKFKPVFSYTKSLIKIIKSLKSMIQKKVCDIYF